MRRTHKQKVLDLLRDGRWHDHREGYRLGVMLHSRVADLRKDGYTIDCKRGPDGYLYRLVGRLDSEAVSLPAASVSSRSLPNRQPTLSPEVNADGVAHQLPDDGERLDSLPEIHPEQLEIIAWA